MVLRVVRMVEVDAETTVEPVARARPRWRLLLLTALIIVAVIGSVLVFVRTRPPERRIVTMLPIRMVDESSSLSPVPAPNTAAATGGFKDAEPWSWTAARSGGDDHQLVLWFTKGVSPCEIPDGYTTDVDESANGVTIRLHPLREFELLPRACNASLNLVERGVVVELTGPLAGRPLFDGISDTPKPLIDGRTLTTPSWVPVGWAPGAEYGIINGANAIYWSLTYRHGAKEHSPEIALSRQRPKPAHDATSNFPPEWAATHIDIDGTRVEVFRVQQQRTLRIETEREALVLYAFDITKTGLSEHDLARMLASALTEPTNL